MVDKHGFHDGCNYVGIVLEEENLWFCNKCGKGGAIYIWIVIVEWGPGSTDPMCLVKSAWTNEEEANKQIVDQPQARVERIRINTKEGYE